jgi:hypothetical protein
MPLMTGLDAETDLRTVEKKTRHLEMSGYSGRKAPHGETRPPFFFFRLVE